MFKDTPEGETHCFELKHCKICNQMTNHIGCYKCKSLEQESIMEEFKETLEYLALCTLYGKKTTKGIADFFLSKFTTMIEGMEKDINTIKKEVNEMTGSFKYDSCYEDCIVVLQKYKKLVR